jgi:glycosyltransferase involved in cell wall biosynthesis
VPTYRRDFYERLGAITERQYVVLHGAPEPGSGVAAAQGPFGFQHIEVRNRFWRVLGRTLVYQPVLLEVARGEFDALVVGHEVKYLANMLLVIAFRALGRPVLLWGFGRNLDIKTRSRFGRGLSHIVRYAQGRMLRLATDFLAYTQSGADHVRRAGIAEDRVVVLNNTIDISGEVAAHARAQALDRAALRTEMGLPAEGTVFLFIGRLNGPKRVDALIAAAGRLRAGAAKPIDVLIVGEGPEEAALRAQAAGAPWCHFLGAVHQREALSRIFRVADALVIPGYVGLAVNHAFAHGLPVITCHSAVHSPEVEYIEDGRNGLVLPSLESLETGLRQLTQSRDLCRRLAAGALASRDKLELGRMVEAFDLGVRRAIARRPSARRRWWRWGGRRAAEKIAKGG